MIKNVYAQEFVSTQDGHEIFYQLAGNAQATPFLVVHGGPGAGCSLAMLDFFDLDKCHIILVDQRGAGKSKPHADLTNNTTAKIIADFELIRKLLKIDSWVLFGGSWGSTLSLAYAIKHPEVIRAMILRGIFLSTQQEIAWLFEGVKSFKLEAWQDFVAPLSADDAKDVLKFYYTQLTEADLNTQQYFAKKFAKWEASLSTLEPDLQFIEAFLDKDLSYALARIEAHYLINNCFFPSNNYLLDNINLIEHIPLKIIQGLYDLVCPPVSASKLHFAYNNSELITTVAGHSAFDKANKSALIAAVNSYLS